MDLTSTMDPVKLYQKMPSMDVGKSVVDIFGREHRRYALYSLLPPSNRSSTAEVENGMMKSGVMT